MRQHKSADCVRPVQPRTLYIWPTDDIPGTSMGRHKDPIHTPGMPGTLACQAYPHLHAGLESSQMHADPFPRTLQDVVQALLVLRVVQLRQALQVLLPLADVTEQANLPHQAGFCIWKDCCISPDARVLKRLPSAPAPQAAAKAAVRRVFCGVQPTA